MKAKWFAALFPAIVGLVLLALTSAGKISDPTIYLRADLGMFALLVGLLVSVAAVAFLVLSSRTERRRESDIAAALAQAAEEKHRFLRRLDHELKNPLTGIRAALANLRTASEGTARREALKSAEAQDLRIGQLTADLRKLAELETLSLERNVIDVAELVREAVALAQEQPGCNERQLALTLPQAPWPLPPISGDRDLILVAVYNLLGNALKFTRTGDTIEVRAFEDGPYVVIEVADTGPGIPDDEVPYVWEELYRGRETRGVPGAGLGLTMVRAIVERHAGTVSLRSRAGQGTVVTIRLPAH